jgi:cytochrome c-type biogenesis protein CcmE
VDLTPATSAPARRRRSPAAYAVLAIVVVALGVVVAKGLSSASLYFYNADEAVAQRQDLGDKRFRLQGSVLGDTIDERDGKVDFAVAFNGVRVQVHHEGSPPELFKPGIPVVLEGRWDRTGDFFDSDRILVKHSEQYEADNGDRLKEAERGATSTTSGASTSTPAPSTTAAAAP